MENIRSAHAIGIPRFERGRNLVNCSLWSKQLKSHAPPRGSL